MELFELAKYRALNGGGGGSGGSQLHYATITFVCNLQYGYMIPYYLVENNEVVYRYTEVSGGGGTVTVDVLFGLNDDDPEEDHFVLDLSLLTSQFADTLPDIAVTNTVNCVHTSIILTITDPDSPASATITING